MTARKPPPGVTGHNIQRDYTANIEPYWFQWADQWWELPHLKLLDFEVQLDVLGMQGLAEDLTDAESAKNALNSLFDLLMDPEQAAEWRKVSRPIGALMDILGRWRTHCDVSEEEAGESSASTGSSVSTGRPSSRTSAASTKSASAKRSTPRARKPATPRASS